MELTTETAAAAGRRYAEIDVMGGAPQAPLDAFGEYEWDELKQEEVDAIDHEQYGAFMKAFMAAYRAVAAALSGLA